MDPNLEHNDPLLPHTIVSWGERLFKIAGTHASDHIFKVLSSEGMFYEHELLLSTRELLREGDFVIDVGANIGNHSIFWAGVCGARVLAIEPSTEISQVLHYNIGLNNLESLIRTRQYALGKSRTFARVERGADNNAGQTRMHIDGHGKVPVLPLDDIPEVYETHVNCIKIDVEGMEMDVLLGARKILTRDNPLVICECLNNRQYSQVSNYLLQLNYVMVECFNYSPTYIFVNKNWQYPPGFSRDDHIMTIVGRSSRTANLNDIAIKQLNQRMKLLKNQL